MALKLQNNAISRLATGIGSSDTLISITPGDGAKFPTLGVGDWHPLTLLKADGSLEIVKCTARTSDTLTIERAQEGTSAQAFDVNDRVELRVTAATLNHFWSPDNQGAGSGLDADTLDGMDAATANIPGTLVARDANGGFSAGDITAEKVESDAVEAGTVDATTITATDKFVGDLEGKADEATKADKIDGGTVKATTVEGTAFIETESVVLSTGADAGKIDLAKGNHFRFLATGGTTTLSVVGMPTDNTKVASFVLEISNGGNYPLNFWSGIRWADGEAPTLTTNGIDMLGFRVRGNGTSWYGFVLGQDMRLS